MKELKCPKCGNVFTVDPNIFDSLAQQVRNAAFDEEISRREAVMRERMAAQHGLKAAEEKRQHLAEIARREAETLEFQSRYKVLEEKFRQAESLKEAQIRAAVKETEARLSDHLAEKDRQLSDLQRQIDKASNDKEIALLQTQKAAERELARKDLSIHELQDRIKRADSESAAIIAGLKEQHANELAAKDREIQFHKDYKMRLSTKMIGESLEIHCFNLFAEAQSMGMFPDATLDKDNDLHSGGTKGDFIFRDYMDGREYVSIMFEMKNESDTPGAKHRNDEFLEKLHKDRCDKRCEYAVLVSMLEKDSEVYNGGIVNKSHLFPRMYVIRPQMFMVLIALICQISRKSAHEIVHLRRELDVVKRQNIDVTNFEARRDQFAEAFGKLVEAHRDKQQSALSSIDKVIEGLERQADALRKVKQLFEASGKKLDKANETVENDFTIKKLTRANPTMKALFEEARKMNPDSDISNPIEF